MAGIRRKKNKENKHIQDKVLDMGNRPEHHQPIRELGGKSGHHHIWGNEPTVRHSCDTPAPVGTMGLVRPWCFFDWFPGMV